MLAVLYVVSPVLVALIATACSRTRWPSGGPWIALTGVPLALGFVLLAYLDSPSTGAPYNGCSDCGDYLGHFWEPQVAVLLAVAGYALWLLGIGAGIAVAMGIESRRTGRTGDR